MPLPSTDPARAVNQPPDALAEIEAIMRQVLDDLVAEGMAADEAELTAMQVGVLLGCGRWSPELVVAGIVDRAGRLHSCVLPALPLRARRLHTLDMAAHRRRAQSAMPQRSPAPAAPLAAPLAARGQPQAAPTLGNRRGFMQRGRLRDPHQPSKERIDP